MKLLYHLTILNAVGVTVLEKEADGFSGIAFNQWETDGTALIFDAKNWEDGASVFIESDETWLARKRREERLRDAAPDLLAALRLAHARFALLWPDRQPSDDAAWQAVHEAIGRVTGNE